MEYSISINFFTNQVGIRKAAELVSKAGFTQLDYNPPIFNDNWKELFKSEVEVLNEYGLKVHQAHFPFNRYGWYNNHRELIDRLLDCGESLGVKYYAVHGDEIDFESTTFSKEAALEYNHNYFLPYVERAKKNGYKIAFETVFEDWKRNRFTSEADDLYNLITSYNSESAV